MIAFLPMMMYNKHTEEYCMKFTTVANIAKKWNVSERTVRNYCSNGKIDGAFLAGKTWNIPVDANRPERINKRQGISKNLLEALKNEKESNLKGGIYHRIQVDLTYNSNHIEGSTLTHDQTRHVFETKTIEISNQPVNTDDLIETINHFECIRLIIDNASHLLTESLIKKLHYILKRGTSDSEKEWFAVGDYKRLPNEVGGRETTPPEKVGSEMKKILRKYNETKKKTFEDIVAFHADFEWIHPFQDGNGRIGRLIMFKECIRNNVVPFIIDERTKLFYYRGFDEWRQERGYLLDTCLNAQDAFKKHLDYFKIPYKN